MKALQDIDNMDDLGLMLEELSGEVSRLHGTDHSSIQEVQLLANALTRAELALNDLERREACLGRPSREMADRCIALRSRIRAVRDALDRATRRDDP